MQPATEAAVLGDFKHTAFTHDGITSAFYRIGARFMVRTDGPGGSLHDYAIAFTFGVYPLQQYLIAMPGGRLQALGIAWDSRSRDQGGQRWFFLYPGQRVTNRDPLHWTALDQTWNYMCADCHSTNLRKNYSLQTRGYATTYAAINVACEACHGPGSNHVLWARKQGDWQKFATGEGLTIALDEREGVSWTTDPASGEVRRSQPRNSDREIEMCARCHARRGQIHEDYVHGQPVGDDYRVALLDRDLFFPDGQIESEDYEYGSFIQSRMFHAGVTCSDCHDPHSLKLRADGNNICLQCHSAQKYDAPTHHFHQAGTAGAQCANCHMPARTYMVIDSRRDHSIRIPRPDLSVKMGVPNACNQCHTNQSAQWATDAVVKWYGHAPQAFQHFATALEMGAAGAPGAQPALAELAADEEQPAIARATALASLAAYAPLADDTPIRLGVRSSSAMVRRAAATAIPEVGSGASAGLIVPLLTDSVRDVRIETANTLAGVPVNELAPDAAAALRSGIAEYIAAQELNADRPESHMNLGLLYADEKQFDRAEAELKIALSIDPSFYPAVVNLADLDRELGREAEGEALLRQGLKADPQNASLLHALGLAMVRQKRGAEALELLGAAARQDPSNARYTYVYAIALNGARQPNAAIEVLTNELILQPYDRDAIEALVTFYQQAGNPAMALNYALRLSKLEPGNEQLRELITELKQPTGRQP